MKYFKTNILFLNPSVAICAVSLIVLITLLFFKNKVDVVPHVVPSLISNFRDPIIIDYENSTPEIRKRVGDWYETHYEKMHNTLGGPCEPFSLKVSHKDGGFTSGGGGVFLGGKLGDYSILHANSPLESKNFEHVFSHELAHAFWNGIWIKTPRINATPSWMHEGVAEYLSQVGIVDEVRAGNDIYRQIWSYLPAVMASYDSYRIQENATGKSWYWREQDNFNTSQAMIVFALMEEISPGFLKRLQDKLCLLPRSSYGGTSVIMVNPKTLKDLVISEFGSKTIEGLKIGKWLDNQPVTNSIIQEGSALRITFQNIPKKSEQLVEGASINPEIIQIVKIIRENDEFGGKESTHFNPDVDVQVIDWRGNVYSTGLINIGQGSGILVESLNLEEGAYKILATDKNSGIQGETYFLMVPQIDSSQNHLFGSVIGGGNIMSDGSIVSDAGTVNVVKGYFMISFSGEMKEFNLHGDGWSRNVFFSDWSSARFVLINK